MANDVSIKFGAQGDKEFKSAVSGINSQIKNLNSEMKVAVSGMADMDDQEASQTKQLDILQRTFEATKQKVSILSTEYDKQKSKLDELGKQLEETKNREGATTEEIVRAENAYNKQAQAVNNLGTQINNATAEMNGIEGKMKSITDGTDDASESLEDAGKNASIFGSVLSAQVVSEAIINGVKKLASAMKDLATGSAKYADDILTQATVTGLSTDALQEYYYMTDLVDVSVDTITGSLTKLTKNMQTASKGTGDAYKAFEALGVTVTKADGSLRDNKEVFDEVIDALGKMDNETQKDAYAMNIFGKSAKDLNPLIAQGAENLEAFRQEAHDVGAVMSEENLKANGALQDSLDRLSQSFEALKRNLGTGFAPVVSQIVEALSIMVTSFDNAKVVGQTFSDLIADMLSKVTENLPKFFDSATEIITSLVEGLGDSLPKLLPKMAEAIMTMVTGLLNNLPKIFEAGGKIISGLITGLLKAIPTIIKNMPQIIAGIVKGLIAGFGEIVNVGAQLVQGLWQGIQNSLGWLWGKITDFANGIVQRVKDAFGIASPSKVFKGIGGFLAQGLGEGWKDGLKDVAKNINGTIGGVLLPSAVGGININMSNAFNGGYNSQQGAQVVNDLVSQLNRALGRRY